MINPKSQEFHPDQDLEPPVDDLLDIINSKHLSDHQLDQVLQIYETYTENLSLSRQVNAHITYCIVQANQAVHGSFVDRGSNGGPAGSDVRVFNTSPRQCTLSGIDNHEIPGPDLVQCTALVDTNHVIVNLIMNMLILANVIAFIHQDRLNGIPTVELWVISFLEISLVFPLIAVDINELMYLCRSKRAVYRPCYSYC